MIPRNQRIARYLYSRIYKEDSGNRIIAVRIQTQEKFNCTLEELRYIQKNSILKTSRRFFLYPITIGIHK